MLMSCSRDTNGETLHGSLECLTATECCQDDSVNCSCFRKDKLNLKACSIHVPARVRSIVRQAEEEKDKQQGRQRQGRDGVSVQICQLSSSVVPVRTTISHIHFRTTISHSRKRIPNFFASARVRNPPRCFVKRSAVLFFVSTRLTD